MDIFNLLKSKTRKKILKFFFKNQEKKCYLRELERTLDLPVGNIRRELISLEKLNLFEKERMGNQLYYSLNKKSPYFEGIGHIMATAGDRGVKKPMKVEMTSKSTVLVEKDDLNTLISRINELESTIDKISKNVPRNSYFPYQLSARRRHKKRMITY